MIVERNNTVSKLFSFHTKRLKDFGAAEAVLIDLRAICVKIVSQPKVNQIFPLQLPIYLNISLKIQMFTFLSLTQYA